MGSGRRCSSSYRRRPSASEEEDLLLEDEPAPDGVGVESSALLAESDEESDYGEAQAPNIGGARNDRNLFSTVWAVFGAICFFHLSVLHLSRLCIFPLSLWPFYPVLLSCLLNTYLKFFSAV